MWRSICTRCCCPPPFWPLQRGLARRGRGLCAILTRRPRARRLQARPGSGPSCGPARHTPSRRPAAAGRGGGAAESWIFRKFIVERVLLHIAVDASNAFFNATEEQIAPPPRPPSRPDRGLLLPHAPARPPWAGVRSSPVRMRLSGAERGGGGGGGGGGDGCSERRRAPVSGRGWEVTDHAAGPGNRHPAFSPAAEFQSFGRGPPLVRPPRPASRPARAVGVLYPCAAAGGGGGGRSATRTLASDRKGSGWPPLACRARVTGTHRRAAGARRRDARTLPPLGVAGPGPGGRSLAEAQRKPEGQRALPPPPPPPYRLGRWPRRLTGRLAGPLSPPD